MDLSFIKSFFKTKYALFIILFLTSIVAFLDNKNDEILLKSYLSPNNLVIIEAILLLGYIIIYLFSNKENLYSFITDINKLSYKNIIFILTISFLLYISTIADNNILKEHGTLHFTSTQYIMKIFVTSLVLFLFEREKISINKIAGLILLFIGIFLFST